MVINFITKRHHVKCVVVVEVVCVWVCGVGGVRGWGLGQNALKLYVRTLMDGCLFIISVFLRFRIESKIDKKPQASPPTHPLASERR